MAPPLPVLGALQNPRAMTGPRAFCKCPPPVLQSSTTCSVMVSMSGAPTTKAKPRRKRNDAMGLGNMGEWALTPMLPISCMSEPAVLLTESISSMETTVRGTSCNDGGKRPDGSPANEPKQHDQRNQKERGGGPRRSGSRPAAWRTGSHQIAPARPPGQLRLPPSWWRTTRNRRRRRRGWPNGAWDGLAVGRHQVALRA